MAANEKIEALMFKFFPKCPLCGEKKGYVIGWAKNTVECKVCHAKWFSEELVNGENLTKLTLKEPANGGKGNTLLYKEKSILFWQDQDVIRTEEEALRIPEKLEKIDSMRCPLCSSYMLSAYADLRIGGWSGLAYVVSENFVSEGLKHVGEIKEELLPVMVYFCAKCGKMEFVATEKARQKLFSK